MYLFGNDTIIDVQEEKCLIDEDAEVITYDDLNITTHVITKMPPSPIPRPRLIIPKSPTMLNVAERVDSVSDSDSDSLDTDNVILERDPPIQDATPPIILEKDDVNVTPFIERKYVYYTVNSVLCGVLLYVILFASGTIS